MSSSDYFSRIDALRFFAFFAVFISHVTFFMAYPAGVKESGTFYNSFLQLGSLGVSFFFVLSGFLITYYLNKEYLLKKTISLKKFYVRRILRIWPLYFLTLFLAAVVSSLPMARVFSSVDLREFLAHLFLVGNWFRAFYGSANEMVSVLWSVAVEEQFYLFWPIIFLLFRKNIKWAIIIGIIVTFIFRWIYAADYDAREYFSPCLIAYFMIGGFYAIYFDYVNKKIGLLKNNGLFVGLIWMAILLVVRGIFFKGNFPGWFAGSEPLLYGASFILFINHAIAHSNKPYLFSSFLEYLGKISYGLYTFHMIIFMLVKSFIGNSGLASFVLVFCISLILTFLAAAMSYKFWEKPFLRLKHKFSFKEEVEMSY